MFWLIAAGLVLLGLFAGEKSGSRPRATSRCSTLGLLKIPRMRAGLIDLCSCQQFIIMGTFFVLPLYLQTVLGFDSLETGITILPLSLSAVRVRARGARWPTRFSPKRIVAARPALHARRRGPAALLHRAGPAHGGFRARPGAGRRRAGADRLAARQRHHVVGPAERGGEAGGLQGTSLNLGASLGTALVGSILIAALVANFQTAVLAEPGAGKRERSSWRPRPSRTPTSSPPSRCRRPRKRPGCRPSRWTGRHRVTPTRRSRRSRPRLRRVALFALLALWYVRALPKKAGTADEPANLAAAAEAARQRLERLTEPVVPESVVDSRLLGRRWLPSRWSSARCWPSASIRRTGSPAW